MERDRYFAFLLRILPTAFRGRHGEELTALLEQMKRDLGPQPGALTLLRFYAALTWDVVRQARGARSRGSREAGGRAVMPRHDRRLLWRGLLSQSLTSAWRTARHQPGFTAAVVVTLGLGIGANATMYGIVDRLLLRPPAHVVEHERVHRVFVERRSRTGTGESVMEAGISYLDYRDLDSHAGLAAIAAYAPAHEETIGRGNSGSRARVAEVSGAFFELLGVSPMSGRFYTAEESTRGLPLTAVISAEHWVREYGSDPDVLGRTLEVYGQLFTLIGVAPPGFTGINLAPVDIWLPLEATFEAIGRRAFDRECCSMGAVVRLKEGVSVEAAEAEATSLVLGSRGEDPALEAEQVRLDLQPLTALQDVNPQEATFDPARGPGFSARTRVAVWLGGVSILVFLIACANVASLLLARGTSRAKNVAVRVALGAGRGRVAGEMIVESVALAAAGGLLALVLARWAGEVIASTILTDVVLAGSALTGRVLVFTAVAAVAAGVAAGIVPSVQGSRADIAASLAGSSFRGGSARRSRLRVLLTVSQASLSVVLLVGAGLFLRSLGEARAVDLGLDVDRLLHVELEFNSRGAGDIPAGDVVATYEDAIRRLEALPGVHSAAATTGIFQNAMPGRRFSVPGMATIPDVPGGGPYSHWVSPRYFETVGVEVVEGRPFESADFGAGSAPVALINETMASVLRPSGSALGECLLFGSSGGAGGQVCTTIVGVAEDAARDGFRDAPGLTYYVPQRPGWYPRRLYVRADGDPEVIKDDVAALLRSLSPIIRYADVRTMEDLLDPKAHAWRLGAALFTAFGLLALSVAAVGLYSVLAFDVAQRTRELGIRAALGATRARLLGRVVLNGVGLAASGVALGIAISFVAAPYLGELLFEVSPRDPRVFGGVAFVLLGAGWLASLVPAFRATNADPTDALRAE